MPESVMTLEAAATPAPPLAHEELELLVPVYPMPRLMLASGRGARVTDADGRTYLDFVSGIAVNAFGHAPAGLARTVAAQMKRLGQCSNLFANQPALDLARALVEATGYDRVFFCNSGTEGIEAALKFARAHARARGRSGRDFVAFEGSFHGRTGFAVSVTSTASYREPFEPLVPGVRFGLFNQVDGLDLLIDEGVAAVIVEPIQGEGGAIPATREFLAALRERSREVGAVLVFDEVQSGMGRTGTLLAAEPFGVRADITVLSKALGGGLPLAAVLTTAEVANSLSKGQHGCTFGGGPVVTAAGLWVVERVRNPRFLERVRKRAARLGKGLEDLTRKHPSVREARGLGLLRAIELEPDAGFDVPALVAAAREHGLLVVRGGERALRLLPPLDVSPAEIAEALHKLDAALTQLEQLENKPPEAAQPETKPIEAGAAATVTGVAQS